MFLTSWFFVIGSLLLLAYFLSRARFVARICESQPRRLPREMRPINAAGTYVSF